jgi:hypothetical protein
MKTTSPSIQEMCLNSFIIQNMDATTSTICSKVLVNVCKAFFFGSTYIMLPKVTKRKHFKIAH